MKPSTVRALVYGFTGLLAMGLILTLTKGKTRGARDIAVAIVGLALFGALAGGAWWMRTQPRREAAQDAARSLGLRYSATDAMHLIDRPFALFRRPATVRGLENMMVGTWRGDEVTVCEYWYARSSNPALDDVEWFTCVMTPLPGWWPDLVLTRETVATRSIEHLTRREVNLESEDFNRTFSVRSADPRFANALLDARMMRWLLDLDAVSGVEIADGTMLWYRPRVEPWALQPVLEAASGFRAHVPEVVSNLFPAP